MGTHLLQNGYSLKENNFNIFLLHLLTFLVRLPVQSQSSFCSAPIIFLNLLFFFLSNLPFFFLFFHSNFSSHAFHLLYLMWEFCHLGDVFREDVDFMNSTKSPTKLFHSSQTHFSLVSHFYTSVTFLYPLKT